MKTIKFSDFINGLQQNNNPDFLAGVKANSSIKSVPSSGSVLQLYKGTINMNATSDQLINLSGGSEFVITDIVLTNASVNLNVASDFEIWDSVSRSGNQICSSVVGIIDQLQKLTSPNKIINRENNGIGFGTPASPLNIVSVGNSIYASLGSPQGTDSSVDCYVFGYKLQ